MTDFLIIGAGIIGLLTARELIKRGATVTLIDKGAVGQEASWAGGGIISPLYPWRYSDAITQLAARSQRLYPELAQALQNETGIDIELIRSGMIMLDSHDKIPALAWAKTHQVTLDYLSSHAIAGLQTDLGIAAEALWMPEVMQVRNPRLLQALALSLKQNKVDIIEHQAVKQLYREGTRITHVATLDQTLTADNIIITAGAWSSELLGELAPEIKITPVRGQMLLFNAPEHKLTKMVLYRNHYLIPRRDDLIIAGSSLEYQSGFNKIPTLEALNELSVSAYTLFPDLRNATLIAQWAGLRPYATNGEPAMGLIAPYDNLYINAGHFRNGLVLAPGAVERFCEHYPIL